MEKYNNWKLKFYTIWAGQAVSLITSAILQMAIIFYLTEKTGSAMVLSMASLVGFLRLSCNSWGINLCNFPSMHTPLLIYTGRTSYLPLHEMKP